jgi:TolB-like protein/tetratricopeptide (TPR) repeat protein
VSLDIAQLQDRLQAALGPNYRIERSLGQGGMGVVYLGRDLTLDRQVAVKVVHPELAVHGSITQRFLSEARVIARLRHPNIVAVHAAGETTGVFWYVMDYVPGETLRDRLNREGTIPHDEVRRITAELADALDAAGRQGVVHRDVKPENILLDADGGRALLADFGVARVLEGVGDPARPITGQGVAVGTPSYMSPEQASSDVVDHRSDLYALGIVAYEMLTGQVPFRGSPAQVAAQQINVPPAPIERVLPLVPAGLAAAVMRALAKSPSARFGSGAEFRAALLEERAPIVRHRSSWQGWAALAAVVIAAIGITWVVAARDGPPRGIDPRHSIVILPFDNLRGDTALAWLEQGSISMLGLTLAQWEDMTVVDQERVHDLLTKRGLEPGQPVGLDAARAIAREAGVWSLVVGDFVRTGDSLHVAARLIDVASGQRVDLAQSDVLVHGDVRPAFDQLAAQLLNVSGAPEGLRPGLAAATTGVVEAYRSYLGGIDRLNQWDLTGADSMLRDATRRDPEFALAWFKLALTRGWIGGEGDSVGTHAIGEALQHVARLPLREQSLVRGYRAFLDGDHARAVQQYTTLLRKDSTDTDAWYGLGDAWYHTPATDAATRSASMNASLRAFRRALAIDPTYALAYDHVAAMYRQLSRPDPYLAFAGGDSVVPADGLSPAAIQASVAGARRSGIALAREWVTHQPGITRAHEALVEAYAAAGSVAEADRALAELTNVGPTREPVLTRVTEARIRFGAGAPDEAIRRLTPLYDSLLTDGARLARATAQDRGTLLSGVNALAYAGDVGRAADVLQAVRRARGTIPPNPSSTVDPRHVTDLSIGTLYAAAGGAPDPLRAIWREVRASARRARPDDRTRIARAGTSAAVGLLIGPAQDAAPLAELRSIAGEDHPRDVQGLLALANGDTASARQLLIGEPADWKDVHWTGFGDQAPAMVPLRAYGLVLLGEPERALDLLEYHDLEQLDPRFYSNAFATLGMVRMVRGMAYEQLSRRGDAAREYRAALGQWERADPRQVPFLDVVRLRLGRVTGTG